MNKLKVEYKVIEHPYPDEEERSVYGLLTTTLVDNAGNRIILLTQEIYDLLFYFNWFISNSVELLNQNTPKYFPDGGSISERIRKFLNQVNDDDKWEIVEENNQYDKYYDYSMSHSYFDSLKGRADKCIKFPRSIYLGLNTKYEISMFAEEDLKRKIKFEHWVHEFDLPEFIKFAEIEYNKIISNPNGHNEISLKKYF